MKSSLKDFWSIGVLYFIGIGCCYLFGYWGALGVNVLEFIGLADIAKLALFPLLASLVFGIAGSAFSELLTLKRLPPGGGAESTLGRAGHKYGHLVLAANLFIIVFLALFGPEPGKWFAIALLVSFFSIPLTHQGSVIALIPNPKLRATLAHLLFLLPAVSFAYGRLDAHQTIHGDKVRVVDIARTSSALIGDLNKPVIYLGLLGSTYVLRETKTGQTVFMKQKDDAILVLRTGGT